jgi:hypothetical protein
LETDSKANGSALSRRHAVAAIAILLSGCAAKTNGPAANSSVAQALSFKPPEGQSGIYVIRQGGVIGAAATWRVDLDVDNLGAIGTNQYLYATVPPGDHNLQMLTQEEGTTFRTEPNKNYFFTISVPFFQNHIEQISEDRGRQLVSEMSR